VTALRWARIFRRLGWQVFRRASWKERPCDVMVALHARKSHDSIVRFHRAYPDKPIVVAGTGTDLYTDVEDTGEVKEALGLASRIVVLQPDAIDVIPPEHWARTRVIYQSLAVEVQDCEPDPDIFEVCVLAHLRPVKDPLAAARAARLLPADSRVRVTHLGEAITPEAGKAAEVEMRENERYLWLGARPRREALSTLKRSRLLLSTSRHEGGANALSEALGCGVPVLATDIPGATGLLGKDYPGLYPVGDDEALAALLSRAETDADFYAQLRSACADQAWVAAPEREQESWKKLLEEVLAE